MFQWMGLETNLDKTKALVCTPGYIWGKWSEAAYKRRATREGGTFREKKRVRVGGGGGGPPPSYLCGFLPLGAEDSYMLSDGISGSSA